MMAATILVTNLKVMGLMSLMVIGLANELQDAGVMAS